jgi:hypothetical protein
MSGTRSITTPRAFIATAQQRASGRPAGHSQPPERAVCWWCGRPLRTEVLVLVVRDSCPDCSETLSVPGRYLG